MLKSTIDYSLIGRRIQEQRTKQKITQEQMSNDLNLSIYYISRIENGKSCPTLDTLALIANYLNLDLAFLISGSSTLEKNYYFKQLDDIVAKASDKQLNLIIKIAKNIIEDY